MKDKISKTVKKLLSIILTLALLICNSSLSAFAADTQSDAPLEETASNNALVLIDSEQTEETGLGDFVNTEPERSDSEQIKKERPQDLDNTEPVNTIFEVKPLSITSGYIVYFGTTSVTLVGSYDTLAEACAAVNSDGSGADYTILVTDDDTSMGAMATIDAGKSVTLTSGTDSAFTITQIPGARHITVNGTLILENITLDGGSVGGGVSMSGGVVVSGGTLEMKSGAIIAGCYSVNNGGGAYLDNSNFTMNDGAVITGCSSDSSGSGVYLINNSVFTMNGGKISNNHQSSTSGASGGGICLDRNSTFTMNDGEIIDNSAVWGGGVEVGQECIFTMDGGKISNNKATTQCGGGVHVYVHGTFMMNGGTISSNKTLNSGSLGGGVFVGQGSHIFGEPEDWCKFIMNDGSIKENEAFSGGGVAAYWNGQIEMNGGSISLNTAAAGGGVYVANSQYEDDGVSFIMKGGEITGNMATDKYGGGIWAYAGKANPDYDVKVVIGDSTGTSGTMPLIHGNSANTYGGGIYLYGSKVHATIYDGKIYKNTANNSGGGIGIDIESKLDMHGGIVGGETAEDTNWAKNCGGGIYIYSNSTFTMNNGKIMGNKADTDNDNSTGGGVALLGSNPVFIMNDGEISKNKATQAGGVYVQGTNSQKGIFTMSNGKISENEATTYYGGGVYATATSDVTISGGAITGNKASRAGGIFVGSNSNLTTVSNAYITGNSGAYGGGIRVHTNGVLTVKDSYISDNSSTNGAGIYVVGNGKLILEGTCYVTNNSAVNEGGGIYTENYTGYNGTVPFPGDYSAVQAGDYSNIITAADTVFSKNTASAAYEPPAGADTLFNNVGYDQSSISINGSFVNPLNNYDINYAQVPEITFTVTYDANGGSGSHVDTGIMAGTDYTVLSQNDTGISRSGRYNFTGWNTQADGNGTAYAAGDSFTITGNVTLYAQWSSYGGGGDRTYSVTYNANGGTGNHKDTGISSGSRYTILTLSATGITRNGYTFTGWNTEAGGSGTGYNTGNSITVTGNVTLYAQWTNSGTLIDEEDVPLGSLDLSNHFAYIVGYPDGTVKPGGNITRAEVSAIFFRLLTQESRMEIWNTVNSYSDVGSTQWYNNSVSTLTKGNILKGYSDGTFRPNSSITRAELATIAAKFAKEEDITNITGKAVFSDISGHWAESYITLASGVGYVQGYGDSTFRPDEPITRAEVVTLLNNVLNRHVESENDLLNDMITWPDNTAGSWYYYAMQEATNSHYFDRKDDGVNERWTTLRSVPNWSVLNAPSAQPGDISY